MAGNFFELTRDSDNELYRKAEQGYVAPTYLEGRIGAFREGFEHNIFSMGKDVFKSMTASESEKRMLTPEEANAIFNPPEPFTTDISHIDASIRVNRQKTLIQQRELAEGSDIVPWIRSTWNFMGAMADPVALLGGIGMASVIGKASAQLLKVAPALRMMQTAGSTAAGRASFHLGRELAENLAFTSILEVPLAHFADDIHGTDTTWRDHAFNIAAGTAMGGTMSLLSHNIQTGRLKHAEIMEAESLAHTIGEEFTSAMAENRAPKFDEAVINRLSEIEMMSTSPRVLDQMYTILGEFDDVGDIFYSTHKSHQRASVSSSVNLGRTFGSGLHMVNNPALAVGKALHLDKADVVKFDSRKFRLLNIDLPATPAVRTVIHEVLEAITKDPTLKVRKPISDVLKNTDDATPLKTILQNIDTNLAPELAEGVHDAINARLAKEHLVDGYRFREDLTGQGRGIGDGIFIFKDTQIEKATDAKQIPFETAPYRDEWERVRQERADFVASKKGANYFKKNYENNMKQIERDSKATREFNREYDITNSGPLYRGESWQATYNETFSLDSRLGIEAPVQSMNDVVDEYVSAVEELRETVALMDKTVEDGAVTINNDVRASTAKEAEGLAGSVAVVQKTMEELDHLVKMIDEADKAIKATVSCIRRN